MRTTTTLVTISPKVASGSTAFRRFAESVRECSDDRNDRNS